MRARLRRARLRPARLGLRARVTLAFALGGLLLSALLAGTTFALTRANLLDQREGAVLTQVYFNARLVRNSLPVDPEVILDLLGSLQTPTGSRPVLLFEERWFSLTTDFGEDALPASLRRTVQDGSAARMRYQLRGRPELAVGVPLAAENAAYFEIVELDELEDTLRALGFSLLGAGAVTTLAGAGVGWWASRRVLRPLADVGVAASAIAGGRLDTRLEPGADPDLAVLAASFNDMAQALQSRIERDARFASDVSHELRSPLMTLSAAVEVLDTRRDELSDRVQAALDLLVAEVARFQQLVEDLLEISRFDAGAAHLELDEVRIVELVMQAVRASSDHEVPVELDADLADTVVQADKRRLVRVIANLLDNAEKYGEGASRVALRGVEGGVRISVEDNGPGVPAGERALIFDRFARGGGGAGRRGRGEGVGLGLALVAEHVRLHGGRVWVEGRDDGAEGARFVVELPVLAT